MTALLLFLAGFCFGFAIVYSAFRIALTLQARQRKEVAPAPSDDPGELSEEGGVGEVTPPSHLRIVQKGDSCP